MTVTAHIVHVTITLFRLMTIESQDITSFIQLVECVIVYIDILEENKSNLEELL